VGFRYEKDLVAAFCSALETGDSPWRSTVHFKEFDYRRGRTDVIATNPDEGDILAFEAKLSKWRQALQQAYRNTSFAHKSYVLLPQGTAFIACQYQHLFRERTIGLCYLDDENQVVILIEPRPIKPIQEWLTCKARNSIFQEYSQESL